MGMYVKNNTLYIFVADSDAVKENRIKGSTNSAAETTNYCPPESIAQNKLFYDFLGDRTALESKPVYLNAAKLKSYKTVMITRLKHKYAGVFKGEMADFETVCDELIACGDKLVASKLFLTGDRPYLQFDGNEDWKKLKRTFYGEATTVVVESELDRFVVYPLFHPLFAKINELIEFHGIRDDNEPTEKTEPTEETDPTEETAADDGLIRLEKRSGARLLNPLNSILYGPPGTGKTYSTLEYAVAVVENRLPRARTTDAERAQLKEKYEALVQSGQIVFTTFHQNYGYEDFVQGLRPVPHDGLMDFAYVNGKFKTLAETAMDHPENNYVIIIDEINRGNISKIFGELITLIEEDKRWGEENQMSAMLSNDDVFMVPNNLYVIGTMNSADKSISLIDTALRRRFDFVEVPPDPDLVQDAVLRNVLTKLNGELKEKSDSADMLIGHAYFLQKTADDLAEILNRKIIPLLYEYFYDQSKKVEEVLRSVLDGTNVRIEESAQGRIRVKRA